MDYESLGLAMGLKNVVAARNYAENQLDIANSEIAKANRIIEQLRKENATLKVDAALQQCNVEGMVAFARAMRLELMRVDPSNKILRKVGGKAGDRDRIVADELYDKASLEHAKKLGIAHLM